MCWGVAAADYVGYACLCIADVHVAGASLVLLKQEFLTAQDATSSAAQSECGVEDLPQQPGPIAD